MGFHVCRDDVGIGAAVEEIIATGPEGDHFRVWNRALHACEVVGDLSAYVWKEEVGVASASL